MTAIAMAALLATPMDTMKDLLRNFDADRGSLERRYWIQPSHERSERFARFYKDWSAKLDAMNYDSLGVSDRVDWLLLKNLTSRASRQLELDEKRLAEIRPLIPFEAQIVALGEERRMVTKTDGAKDAAIVAELAKQVEASQSRLGEHHGMPRSVANRGARTVDELRNVLKEWYEFFNGYDPQFSWWISSPYKDADKALEEYATAIRNELVGIKPDDKTTIIGDPIGREALMADLRGEMIAYTPEELFKIAEQEFAWCQKELLAASTALGFGNDTMKAMEHVKNLHAEPGAQPFLIKELAEEAIEFIDSRGLVTVPELCKETWRMDMMSPERQLVSPFFLGGESILVSFPTDTMTQEQKMMSMRGNNKYFARATVQHELIPGHHLQGFMEERYRPDRQLFNTPFWVEGWALYWEFRLWDLGFARTPEEKIGMLFWRMHRCARILFSLGFHLGSMTPEQCVDLLVNKVGHERENAVAEVRRSFAGDYPPLYQAAYMLGGLQIRALQRELVEGGKITDRQFHDTILQNGPIPIEMVRAILEDKKLPKDFTPAWKFYEEGKSRL